MRMLRSFATLLFTLSIIGNVGIPLTESEHAGASLMNSNFLVPPMPALSGSITRESIDIEPYSLPLIYTNKNRIHQITDHWIQLTTNKAGEVCQGVIKNGYVRFDEVGVYPIEGIFSLRAGTVSTWLYFEEDTFREDHFFFQTDDSQFVLYFDTYFSQSWQQDISRMVARGGGNIRVVDSGFPSGNYSEASIIIDNDGSLSMYGAGTSWYSSGPLLEGEWHLVTMTWEGYPLGVVRIYLDRRIMGEKPYDLRYNGNQGMPSTIAIGVLSASEAGETTQGIACPNEPLPEMPIKLMDGGIRLFDLRLYQRSLTHQEIATNFLANVEVIYELFGEVEYGQIIAEHVVQPGETLSHIALKYYGNALKPYYMVIYNANKHLIGPNPNLIVAGFSFKIPELPEELNGR